MMNRRFLIIIILFVAASAIITSVALLSKTETDKMQATITDNSISNSQEGTDLTDWCVEHSVPGSKCTQCNPSLIDDFKASGDWCPPHDLPESHCRLCNQGIEFPQEKNLSQNNEVLDWCVEHSVPESECALCNPSLIDKYKASGDWCPPHNLPESHCRLCNPEIEFPQEIILRTSKLEATGDKIQVSLFFRSNQDICATNDALIQFASSETANRSGITVYRALGAPYETELSAPAEITFDENGTTVITSSIKALVSRWLISPGDVVKKNDPIAILQSPEMAELQARLISTFVEVEVQRKELEREKDLESKNLISESEFERRTALHKKAQAEYIGMRGLLLSSGIGDYDIDKLLENNIVSKEFVLRASASGLIAERIAKLGEMLEDGQALAVLTDPSTLWIEAQLSENQMKEVCVGQKLIFASDDGALNKVKGTVIWVSQYLDTHTRTGVVRARVISDTRDLRAGSFGRVIISGTSDTQSVLVPKDAVQWEGCCNVVFVRESVNRFRPRKVQIADGPGSYYNVTHGLAQGEEIVVNGSFLLKTELKKTSIGAGCCGIEPIG